MSAHQHRRRFLALLLSAAGAPLALAAGARHPTPALDPVRSIETAHALNTQSQPEISMHRKTQARLILAAATALLALGIALGVAIERTPMPGSDPLTVYAAVLHARGAGKGGTVGNLAEYLSTPIRPVE